VTPVSAPQECVVGESTIASASVSVLSGLMWRGEKQKALRECTRWPKGARMRLFAIGDTHLPSTRAKDMDHFN
jgi:hypothetical protein